MTSSTTTVSFGRSLRIGATGPIVIFGLEFLALYLTGRLGGEAWAIVGGIGFLPVLILSLVVYLLVLLVMVAVPRWRARTGSGPGLLLGGLIGTVLVAGVLAAAILLISN